MSANPAIRRVATLGGNICAQGFAAPDLVPALIALNATVEVRSKVGAETLDIEDYLLARPTRPSDEILTGIQVTRQSGWSAHARGLLRQAGEYPVANVSAFIDADDGGTINSARIAVGAVEPVPRRWQSLENALVGQPIDAVCLGNIALDHLGDFTPRDGVDSPGKYRLRILPRLAEHVFADIAKQMQEGT